MTRAPAGRAWGAHLLAFLWGALEATVFFIVPDVLLSFLALAHPRRALVASVLALAGALAGGGALFLWARAQPERARGLLVSVPGIDAALVEAVHEQCHELGPRALLRGSFGGRPYKIYAVELALEGEGLASFLVASIPARWLRFALAVGLAGLGARGLDRLSRTRPALGPLTRPVPAWGLFWGLFYAGYFAWTGW